MKIAVVGAGYAGLALTWNFLKKGADVDLFDGGEGASSASTGLLHKRPGKKGLITLRADEGMRETVNLLELCSKDRKVFVKNQILRIAINDEQKIAFGGERVLDPEGITVFSKIYLDELKKLCSKAKIIPRLIANIDELKGYDTIVLATGAGTSKLVDIKMKRTIGQGLLCKHKENITFSYLSSGHITPTESPHICHVGSTYEHTDSPDPKKAMNLIDQVAKFYPPAKGFEVLKILTGVRVSPLVGYMPIVKEVQKNVWVFTGFGSRGLIYHALFAKELVEEICER